MRGVDHYNIDPCLYDRIDTIGSVRTCAYGCSDAQAPVFVFTGIGIVFGFANVFERNQTTQFESFIHNQELLDTMTVQKLFNLREVEIFAHSDQTLFRRHYRTYWQRVVSLKANIATSHDSDKVITIEYWHAGNVILFD